MVKNDLVKTKEHITSLTNAKVKLNEMFSRVLENLMHGTAEIKQLAFDALDIKVYASRDKTEIRGVIPLELALPTTAQTSGCQLVWTKSFPAEDDLAVKVVTLLA